MVTAEVDRLNGIVREKRQEIDHIYSSIGKAYYEKHKDDADAELSESVSQITALMEEVEAANQSLEKIKRQEKCPVCGAEYVYGSAFCHVCGTKIGKEEPVPEGMKKCPQCGTLVERDHMFCTKCGSRFAPSPGEQASVQSASRTCPQCGSPVEPGTLFCTKCGGKL